MVRHVPPGGHQLKSPVDPPSQSSATQVPFKGDAQDLPLPDSPEVPGMHSCSGHRQAPQQLVSNTS